MHLDVSNYVCRETISSEYSKKEYWWLAAIVIVGMALRFWGLGNVGLHGDEETMAMPALQILESGKPVLPSGMFYPRGLGQLYLMALSVMGFGVSEWAFRFPSAVMGTIGIVLAFFLGKRFLHPKWNMLFVLIIVLCPSMIIYSQTARMYIFVSAFLMLYAILIFRWEATGSWKRLLAAVIVFLAAIQFHQLAVFCSLLFFFPFFNKNESKYFIQGFLGFIFSMTAFVLFRVWIQAQYGMIYNKTLVEYKFSIIDFFLSNKFYESSVVIAIVSLIAISSYCFYKTNNLSRRISITFFAMSLIACFLFQYYACFLLFFCGTVFYLRSESKIAHVFALAAIMLLIIGVQIYVLYSENVFTGFKSALKVLPGKPSPYILIAFMKESFVSFIFYFPILIYFIKLILNRVKVPDHFLFFILSVWIPILGIGMFKLTIPTRYIAHIFPFFILAFLAGLQFFYKKITKEHNNIKIGYKPIIAILIVLILINPIDLKKSVNSGYDLHPDHKGAAGFINSIHRNANDLVIVEDVLQQTYYLGKVDYWLRSLDDAKFFVKEDNGALLDIYTSTPLIGTGQQLEKIMRNTNRGAVYIVGSGETSGKARYLGNGISEVMKQYPSEIMFTGRDQKTLIRRFASIY